MQYVSPRQLARAVGASESSVKRWCDSGRIAMVKTAGGHRRLTLDAATEFLKQSGEAARPELLGLPARCGRGERTIRNTLEDFRQALVEGNSEACQRIVFDLHLSGRRASQIFDSVIAPAFRGIGECWECGEVQVYQERRACILCLRLLDQLKSVISESRKPVCRAIGATPECDPYMLPTSMVEIVLRQTGWHAQSLGSGLPFDTLLNAIHKERPQLFWLSVSHIDDEPHFVAEYQEFYHQIPDEVAVIVGGRGLHESLRQQLDFTAYGDNLQHLESFAKTWKRSMGRSSRIRKPTR